MARGGGGTCDLVDSMVNGVFPDKGVLGALAKPVWLQFFDLTRLDAVPKPCKPYLVFYHIPPALSFIAKVITLSYNYYIFPNASPRQPRHTLQFQRCSSWLSCRAKYEVLSYAELTPQIGVCTMQDTEKESSKPENREAHQHWNQAANSLNQKQTSRLKPVRVLPYV